MGGQQIPLGLNVVGVGSWELRSIFLCVSVNVCVCIYMRE